ncbi:tetratricopeptide (TPR) repeat protein [Duganella sp. 1224]|uniref:VIT domain-containing protein n=1 Tax=Duganella sp. 1224 TaxID=2587052 RepID=UPI0018214536|nr:VIT domain-containing protein [Duganella sp. 1224]NYE60872.1 tetratricopeptide (TPR) repeat protein [Duganella sp. 1224]
MGKWMAMALLAAGLAQAQERTAQPPRPVWPMPPVMVVQGAEQPVRLQRLTVEAALGGSMAQTTLRMVFFNPNRRPLEGKLQFPLLPGQQVSGFALDIEGRMRAAVPVAKARGRQILEAVERARVDPALLEQTQGNNFQLRVFPIPAQGTRTVELTYSETLNREGANWAYRLPLAYGELEQGVALNVTVAGDAAPQVSGAIGEIAFERSGGGYQARLQRASYAASGVLTLLVPASAAPQTYVQQFGGETYFLAEMPATVQRTPRALPKVVGLLWDSSGSGGQRQHDAELAELDRYFRALGNAEVRLTRLRDRAEPVQRFRVVNGDWQALRTALRDTVYDGASALADWQPQADVNEYLLVSDGLLNYGGKQFPQLAARQRLYVLNSAVSADTGRLSALAGRSGGKLVTVRADRPGEAAALLLTEGRQLRLASAQGAAEVLIDDDEGPQGMLRVAGKLLAPAAQLALEFQQQGKATPLLIDVTASAPSHPMAARVWAGLKLHQLEVDYDLHRAAIRRLGTLFGMPTRETSLLVLERLEDYVRYDVAPPPELQAAVEALKRLRGGELAQRRGSQLERVVRQFEQKLAWWEGRTPKPMFYPGWSDQPLTRVEITGSAVGADGADKGARIMRRAPVPGQSPPMPLAPPPAPAAVAAPLSFVSAEGKAAPAVMAGAAQRHQSVTGAPEQRTGEISVSLQRWHPDAGYIARMKAAKTDQLYAIYLDERASYLNSSAFYIDVADLLFERGQRDLALRVLSNLAEMDLENRQVLRILGYRLLQAGQPELAIPVFEKVRELAEEEPQSFRDLGLAYAAAGRAQQAIDQLYEVAIRPWDGRFAEIGLIALAEMNAIIATQSGRGKLDTSRIDPRLLKNMPLDLRVVLGWDADNADMDLWVTDPNGERCYYGHRFTRQGGRLSVDFTGGYGPEEFSLRRAVPGKYKVEVNYFGSSQQVVAGATTLQLRLTTGFGGAGARDQLVNLRLSGRGETVLVGEFEVE